ncbi:MAG: thioredoxin family protein [Candidatus Sumerlaeia bacterium]
MLVPLWFLFPVLMLMAAAAPAQFTPAASSAAESDGKSHVEAILISASDSFVPGEDIVVGVRLRHAPKWHTYWAYAGDAGLPTSIDWDLPAGFEAGAIQWPVPIKFVVSGITGYGYKGETVLLTHIRTPGDFPLGRTVTLKARVNWLECEVLCVPGAQDVALTLTSADKPTPSAYAELIQQFAARVPRPIDGLSGVERRIALPVVPRASGDPFTFQLTLSGETLDSARAGEFDLFPLPDDNVVLDRQPAVRVEAGRAVFTVEGVVTPLDPNKPPRLRGVVLVALKNQADVRAHSFEAVVSGTSSPESTAQPLSAESGAETAGPTSPAPPAAPLSASSPSAPASILSYLWMMVLAFVGGLILNIMPCVLPVISLKVFSFVKQAGESRQRVLFLGVMYSLGVLVSFWVLSVVMVAMRSISGGTNWGALFQFPPFVIAFAAVVFVLALSMLGVFEIAAPGGGALQGLAQLQSREGPVGAFFTGALATLLATPCTAPVLGVAITFALSQPPFGIFLMFTCIGIGMAFPFLILAAAPGWTSLIPRPGTWMIRFKQAMGFILMATAVWLLWVVGRLFDREGRGVTALALTLVFLLALGVGAWMIGSFIDFNASRSRKARVWALSLLVVLGAYSTTVHPLLFPPPRDPDAIEWEAFSPQALDRYRGDNRLIFVDFTADWCLTCKTNEKLVLETSEVRRKLREVNAVALKADFTRQDPEIRRLLEHFGRSGVPLYVIYPPDGAEPIVLPEVITRQLVLDKLSEAARRS